MAHAMLLLCSIISYFLFRKKKLAVNSDLLVMWMQIIMLTSYELADHLTSLSPRLPSSKMVR